MLSFRPWCGPFGWLESRKFSRGNLCLHRWSWINIIIRSENCHLGQSTITHRSELGYSASDFIRAIDAVRGCCCLGHWGCFARDVKGHILCIFPASVGVVDSNLPESGKH
ncbi:hypothetical protein L1049_007948 [Liquidambar formosana]|uniref:Uncharacterized protein n=1 Tax=Liquidambar formosana TaxID=63359 RepID=A0AAP0SA03_LIQFO